MKGGIKWKEVRGTEGDAVTEEGDESVTSGKILK